MPKRRLEIPGATEELNALLEATLTSLEPEEMRCGMRWGLYRCRLCPESNPLITHQFKYIVAHVRKRHANAIGEDARGPRPKVQRKGPAVTEERQTIETEPEPLRQSEQTLEQTLDALEAHVDKALPLEDEQRRESILSRLRALMRKLDRQQAAPAAMQDEEEEEEEILSVFSEDMSLGEENEVAAASVPASPPALLVAVPRRDGGGGDTRTEAPAHFIKALDITNKLWESWGSKQGSRWKDKDKMRKVTLYSYRTRVGEDKFGKADFENVKPSNAELSEGLSTMPRGPERWSARAARDLVGWLVREKGLSGEGERALYRLIEEQRQQ